MNHLTTELKSKLKSMVVTDLLNKLHKKWNLDQKLTPHITLREAICGTKDSMLNQMTDQEKVFFLRAVESELTEKIIINLKQTAILLEVVRAHYNSPIWITCGFRPVAWEKYKSRTGDSQHADGSAFDFYVLGVSLVDVYKYVDEAFKTGGRAINLVMGFVHLDKRLDNRYWWSYN